MAKNIFTVLVNEKLKKSVGQTDGPVRLELPLSGSQFFRSRDRARVQASRDRPCMRRRHQGEVQHHGRAEIQEGTLLGHFFKWPIPGLFFLYFRLFNTGDSK